MVRERQLLEDVESRTVGHVGWRVPKDGVKPLMNPGGKTVRQISVKHWSKLLVLWH